MCDIEHLLRLYQGGKVIFTASEDAMFDEIINLRTQLEEAKEKIKSLQVQLKQTNYQNEVMRLNCDSLSESINNDPDWVRVRRDRLASAVDVLSTEKRCPTNMNGCKATPMLKCSTCWNKYLTTPPEQGEECDD